MTTQGSQNITVDGGDKFEKSNRVDDSDTVVGDQREHPIVVDASEHLNVKSKSGTVVGDKRFVSEWPEFGGNIKFQGKDVKFLNTCPVDTWLAVFKSILEVIQTIPKSTSFERLLSFLKCNEYAAAKFQVAIDNKIVPRKQHLCFYGSEYSLIIQPYLNSYLACDLYSECDNQYCVNRNKQNILSECPTLDFKGVKEKDWISPSQFEDEIEAWLSQHYTTTRCGQRMLPNTLSDHCYPDLNIETG